MIPDEGPKDSVIVYTHPATGSECHVFVNQGQNAEQVAAAAVPEGIEYRITTRAQLHNNPDDPVHSLSSLPAHKYFSEEEIVTRHQLGYFGNIWIRQNFIAQAGNASEGHAHHFDHVSLLAAGSVRVEVDGFEPKEFTAPTFIMVKKEYIHKFTALENNTLWYCVYALRDLDGEVTDIYSGDNSPYGSSSEGQLEKLERLSQ